MKLQYKHDYLSITEFDPIEIPELTILTGVNGSGKSHLLAAIQNSYVIIDGLDNPRIVQFDYETFKLENEGEITPQQLTAEREAAWNLLQEARRTNIKGQIDTFKNNLGQAYELVVSQCRKLDKAIWDLSSNDVDGEDVYEKIVEYRRNVDSLFENHAKLQGNAQATAIYTMAKKLRKSLDEISQFEFNRNFEPYTLKKDFLPTQLGKIFTDYFSKYEENQYNQFRNKNYEENHTVLSDEEFEKEYGPKPWDVINEILQTFSSLPYSINSPEQSNRDDRFHAKLIHNEKSGVSPDFSSLSSGERILLALVASVFKSSSDSHFPDVLLLDEIDASLHPSMIQNLLKVVHDVFLANDVKIILVTHSPTTIALAPEEAIFVMNRGGNKRIEKKSKAHALEILTEGFATLEKGLQLFDEISKTDVSILTEGRNVKYIEKALDLYGITDIDVITGAEGKSGKNQLKTLYDFFVLVPHTKTVLIVWDSDVASYRSLSTKNNTVPFVFDVNPNNRISKKGIENLFSEELFEGFKKVITPSTGDTLIEFDSNRKADFEVMILQRNCAEDFSLLKPLVDKIEEIREVAKRD